MSDDPTKKLSTSALMELAKIMKLNEDVKHNPTASDNELFLAVIAWIKAIDLQSGKELVPAHEVQAAYMKWAETNNRILPSKNALGPQLSKLFVKKRKVAGRFYLLNKNPNAKEEDSAQKGKEKEEK